MNFKPMIIVEGSDGDNLASVENTTIKIRPFSGRNTDERRVAMELYHLEHFQSLVQQHPEYSFEIVGKAPNNHPDFIIKRGDRNLGIELTMLIDGNIRWQVKAFDQIKERLLSEYKNGKLQDIKGINIQFEFGDPFVNVPDDDLSDEVISELVASIEKLAERPFEFDKKIDIFNDSDTPYPLSQSGSVGDNSIRWTVTCIGMLNFNGSEFSKTTGFEVEPSISKGNNDYWIQELERTINNKDVEKNSEYEVLISVGMPDKDGFATTLESLGIMYLIENHGYKISQPKYLKTIYLHCGHANKYYVLYNGHNE